MARRTSRSRRMPEQAFAMLAMSPPARRWPMTARANAWSDFPPERLQRGHDHPWSRLRARVACLHDERWPPLFRRDQQEHVAVQPGLPLRLHSHAASDSFLGDLVRRAEPHLAARRVQHSRLAQSRSRGPTGHGAIGYDAPAQTPARTRLDQEGHPHLSLLLDAPGPRGHRCGVLANAIQHRPGYGCCALKSLQETSKLIRLETRNGSWTRPSGLRYGELARRDDAAGSLGYLRASHSGIRPWG